MSTLSLTPGSTASSPPSTPSAQSRLQMLSRMTPPANSEPLDPTFHLVWPHPQEITQIKGTRFFPTTVLPVVLFRELQSGKGAIDLYTGVLIVEEWVEEMLATSARLRYKSIFCYCHF